MSLERVNMETKKCSCCLQVKELPCFNASSKGKYGKEARCRLCKKEWYSSTKAQRLEQMSEYYIKNKEAVQKKNKIWIDNNRDVYLTRKKEYRQENLEKSRASVRAWAKSNRPKANAIAKKYKVSKLSRTPAWLTEFDLLKMQCLYQVAAMRTRESGQAWHVDHIVPLQGETVSGLHAPWNLRVITASENLSKSNKKWPDMWEASK